MKPVKLLVASSIVCSFSLLSLTIPPNLKLALAQSNNRGVAIFVNGNGDCCTGGMREVRQALRNQGFAIVTTPWDRFSPGAGERAALSAGGFTLGSLSNDRDFVNQLPAFVNSIPASVPVVLIGHSFGGDSLLSAVPRINRRILFLGVLDPVAAGGLRAPIRSRSVPGTVDYFFNRWQTTNAWPVENRTPGANTNGSVRCSARQCDQDEQSSERNADGSEIRTTCSISDVTCPGFRLIPPRPGTAARRLQHEGVPLDAHIQRQMTNQLSGLIANFRPPTPVTGVPISVNFGNTLFYDRNAGVCTFTASNGSVIQRLTTCRRTWHSIIYTANKLLFYDRDAGQIETYRVDNRGLGAQLHSYAPGSMRKTWAQITTPQQGIIVFRDDNGQVETYRLNNIGMLQGL